MTDEAVAGTKMTEDAIALGTPADDPMVGGEAADDASATTHEQRRPHLTDNSRLETQPNLSLKRVSINFNEHRDY
jgi:hypothetical protein